MAKTDLTIPSLGSNFVDLRDVLPGDAYNWSWIRPLSQINCLAIHHTGGPGNQTPQDLANFHIDTNGWGGIGYHFLIDKEGIVYYVGDLQTARANVANLNGQVIGICLIGNFAGSLEPSAEQLDSTRKLCGGLISFPDLVNVKSWDKVCGHKELPDQQTPCPGDSWHVWKTKIIKGVQKPSLGGIVFNPQKTQEDQKVRSQEAVLAGQIAALQETVEYQKTQIESLQVSLATVNGQLISCRESLQRSEAKPGSLDSPGASQVLAPPQKDTTVTLVDALINLYAFAFLSGKVIR